MHVSIPRVIKNKISPALGLISLASFPLERTMHRKVMLIVLSGGVLWTCATPGIPEKNVAEPGPADVEVVELPDDRTCAAARHRSMVGRPIDEIDTAALPRPLRVYPAGSRITMDHRPERMNVVVGPDGRVVKVRCG